MKSVVLLLVSIVLVGCNNVPVETPETKEMKVEMFNECVKHTHNRVNDCYNAAEALAQ